jgi:hypothetical protein
MALMGWPRNRGGKNIFGSTVDIVF